jgi:hypothetical protein
MIQRVPMKRDDLITVDKAIKAMFLFWEDVYRRSGSDTVGSVLGDLSLLPDGTTADPAAYDDFVACVERVEEAERSGTLALMIVSEEPGQPS